VHDKTYLAGFFELDERLLGRDEWEKDEYFDA